MLSKMFPGTGKNRVGSVEAAAPQAAAAITAAGAALFGGNHMTATVEREKKIGYCATDRRKWGKCLEISLAIFVAINLLHYKDFLQFFLVT